MKQIAMRGIIIVAAVFAMSSLSFAANYDVCSSPADDGYATMMFPGPVFTWDTDSPYLHLQFNYSTFAATMGFVRFDISELAGLSASEISSATLWYYGANNPGTEVTVHQVLTPLGAPLSSVTSGTRELMWVSRKVMSAGWNSLDITHYIQTALPTCASEYITFRFTYTGETECLIGASESVDCGPYISIETVPEPGCLLVLLTGSTVAVGMRLLSRRRARAV